MGFQVVTLTGGNSSLPAHVFNETDLLGINIAIASKRPLFLRGEPGYPKREFALAAATMLNRHFIEIDIDAIKDFHDLL